MLLQVCYDIDIAVKNAFYCILQRKLRNAFFHEIDTYKIIKSLSYMLSIYYIILYFFAYMCVYNFNNLLFFIYIFLYIICILFYLRKYVIFQMCVQFKKILLIFLKHLFILYQIICVKAKPKQYNRVSAYVDRFDYIDGRYLALWRQSASSGYSLQMYVQRKDYRDAIIRARNKSVILSARAIRQEV